MYKIFNGQINQLNTGDIQGKLYNTFNCDLTYNQGKMSIAPRTILTSDSRIGSSLPQDTPIGFKYFDTKYFTVAGTKVYVNGGTPIGSFSEDTSNNGVLFPPTDCSSDVSDLEVFNDNLLVSSTTALYSKASASGAGTGLYTLRRNFISVSDYHALATYNNRAYWLDSNQPPRIYSMSTAYAVSTSGDFTLQLPAEYIVTFIRPYSNGLYIGTIHRFGGEGLIFDWDGVTNNKWKRAYSFKSQGALAGYVIGDVLYIVTADGQLKEFDGAGFRKLARLPIKRNLLWRATNIQSSNRFIHPNGMAVIDSNLCMLINNRDNNNTAVEYQENIHSGIWEYTPENGLYHKYSLSYRTRPDAGGSITDYGQITVDRVGGLLDTPDLQSTSQNLKGNFLAGAKLYINSSGGSTFAGTFTDNYYDTLEKAGFFTTVQIRASEVKEMWQKITTLYVPTQGFKFVVKYRTEREPHVDMDITWTGTNTFTTTQVGLSVGDEITIIQGTGSGRIAHISDISFSTPNFTVTLDEEITGVNGTARARKENWKKLGTITSTERKFSEEMIGQPDTLVEIKVAMLGIGELTIDELVLDNAKQQ